MMFETIRTDAPLGMDDFAWQLLDASPVMLCIWGEEEQIVGCNRKLFENFEIKTKEEYAERFFELTPEVQPDGTPSRQGIMDFINKCLLEGQHRMDWMHVLPDGSEFPVVCNGVRIEYRGKRYIVDFMIDMREVKEARRVMQEQYELTEMIFNTAPLAICVWNDDKRTVRMSDYSKEIFGVEEVFTDALELVNFAPEYQPDGKLSTEMSLYHMNRGYNEDTVAFDWMHKRGDGSLLPTHVIFKSFMHKGKKTIVSYTTDLRTIKAAEAKEQQAFAHAQTVVNAAPLIIQQWDADLQSIDCNQFALDFFGCETPADFAGRMWKLVPAHQPDGTPSQEKWGAFLRKIFESSYAVIDFVVHDAAGNPAYFEATGVRANYGGREVVITYSMNVTHTRELQQERYRADLAEESDQAKSRFLASMSHEIRTPITSVLGISEINLRDAQLSPAIEEAFFHIHNSASMLLTIINDILDLSRIEMGEMNLTSEKYETASVISDTFQIRHAHIDSKDIKFNLVIDENLPVYLIGDFVRIEQIINNLLSNAFKYTEEGLVEFSMRAGPGAGADEIMLVITIRDTGLGMTREQVDTIYNEYTRFHNHNKSIGGTGLGMAVVKRLAALMNAKIEIDSIVGKGTTVTISIPQKLGGSAVLGREATLRLQEHRLDNRMKSMKFGLIPENMSYGKVLLVDDVEANLYVAQGLMGFYELQIETCDNGFDAVEKIKAGHVYDIIFMDHMMPELDGIETMDAIRALGYTHPIVVLTANALIGHAEMFIKRGFDGYLSKPIQIKFLDMILNKHIRDKQPVHVLEEAAAAKRSAAGRIEAFQSGTGMMEKLSADFVRRHKNTAVDLHAAIEVNDFKRAHLYAHTLKGSAGLINEPALVDVAESVEKMLESGEIPSDTLLKSLEREIVRALNNAEKPQAPKPAMETPPPAGADWDGALAQLDKLKPLLEHRKNESKQLLTELRAIPEAAIFVKQVDRYDFVAALKSINALRIILEEGKQG